MFGFKGPRKMSVIIPAMTPEFERYVVQPTKVLYMCIMYVCLYVCMYQTVQLYCLSMNPLPPQK